MDTHASSDPVVQEIQTLIDTHAVVLFMKGHPDFPQCGFSANAVRLLKQTGSAFEFVDILSRPDIRATLPRMANWPTFPQLYVRGELIGGSDIMQDMAHNGELRALLHPDKPA